VDSVAPLHRRVFRSPYAQGYALFSGLAFITVSGMVLAPIVHRVLRIFHVEDARDVSGE
jgi:hypothetical protein